MDSFKIKKRMLRFIGFGYLLLGIIVILMSFSGITGFVVGDTLSGGVGRIFGYILIVVGALVLMSGKKSHYEKIDHRYYVKRSNEITRYRGDVWISQWESEGLLNELRDRGYHIEHDEDMPAMHLGSTTAPSKRHVHIENYKNGVDKHLFITPDPHNSKLNTIGVRDGKRILSRVYHPKHPRSSGKEKIRFTDKTRIT